jgi:Xaa-Pro aminopeptidase
MSSLTLSKLRQAQSLLAETGLDAWLIFVRETSESGDPCLPLILEGGLTWQSALIVLPNKTMAVVGSYDADPLISTGEWDEVISYVQDVGPDLVKALNENLQPGAKIGINVSPSDVKADGLTHGMWLNLQQILVGTPWLEGLTSAESLLFRLRGQKTQEELNLILAAIAEGDKIFADFPAHAAKGQTELELYDLVQSWMDSKGLGYSWDRHGDPIVNSGPDSMIGHGRPSSTIKVSPGHILHMDLGVIKDGYSSDIQRCWMVAADESEGVPEDVQLGFEAVYGSISAAAEVLKPGVEGWQVDAAARSFLVGKGYPEYHHAVGHQVGRAAHDGGAILGPAWPRYGNTPKIPVREGEIYTLELGVTLPGRGYLGLEEMVVVTSEGCRFISERQTDMPLVVVAP